MKQARGENTNTKLHCVPTVASATQKKSKEKARGRWKESLHKRWGGWGEPLCNCRHCSPQLNSNNARKRDKKNQGQIGGGGGEEMRKKKNQGGDENQLKQQIVTAPKMAI